MLKNQTFDLVELVSVASVLLVSLDESRDSRLLSMLQQHAAAQTVSEVAKATAINIVLRSARVKYVFPSVISLNAVNTNNGNRELEQLEDDELLMRNPNYGAQLSFSSCPSLVALVSNHYGHMLVMRELELAIYDTVSCVVLSDESEKKEKDVVENNKKRLIVESEIKRLQTVIETLRCLNGQAIYKLLNTMFQSEERIEEMRIDTILQLDSGLSVEPWRRMMETHHRMICAPFDNLTFVPSPAYHGWQLNFVYKSGTEGVGYYSVDDENDDSDDPTVACSVQLFGDDYDEFVIRRVAGAHKGDMYWREAIDIK